MIHDRTRFPPNNKNEHDKNNLQLKNAIHAACKSQKFDFWFIPWKEGISRRNTGILNEEALSTSGYWSPDRRRRWMRGISPRIKGQKWLEGRWISSSRFYSLRIKQKPKLLKLRSRLSWIHARVPWTGVALLSGSRDPLCSSWTPRRNNNSIRLKALGDIYVSFISRAAHLVPPSRLYLVLRLGCLLLSTFVFGACYLTERIRRGYEFCLKVARMFQINTLYIATRYHTFVTVRWVPFGNFVSVDYSGSRKNLEL